MQNNPAKIKKYNINDYNYPKKLRRLKNPPQNIYWISNDDINNLLSDTCIAIVGTRKASKEGIMTAEKFASYFSVNNITIISGLAYGIDASAHKGVLDKNGKTIAVLGHGLDKIYPSSHINMAKKIIKTGGAVISEYPIKTPALSHNFILRNRIISAISDAVVIIEAPIKSGAISTANYAKKINVPVFVIPGSINSKLFEGSNNLIKNGARLTTTPKQVLHEIGYKIKNENINNNINSKNKNKEDYMLIIDSITKLKESANIDNLIKETKLSTQELVQKLSKMIIDDIIYESGGIYILK